MVELNNGPPSLALRLALGNIYWCLGNYSFEPKKVNFRCLNRWHCLQVATIKTLRIGWAHRENISIECLYACPPLPTVELAHPVSWNNFLIITKEFCSQLQVNKVSWLLCCELYCITMLANYSKCPKSECLDFGVFRSSSVVKSVRFWSRNLFMFGSFGFGSFVFSEKIQT